MQKSWSLKVFTFYTELIPQMAPMNWIFLFSFFTLLYLVTTSKIYFY